MRLDTHRLQTLDQVREFLAGSAGLALQPHRRADAYALVATTVQRFDYALCGKPDKGLLRRFLSQATGLSRAQVTRLLRQHRTTGAVTDRRGAPRRPFARRYTRADIGLLAETDALHGTLSGPATRALCARAWRLFGDGRFERLARISNGHLFSVNYFGRLATIILAGSAHHGLRSAARLADTVRGVTRAASGELGQRAGGAAAGHGRRRRKRRSLRSRTSSAGPITAFTPAEAAARPTRPRSDSRADATARASPSRDPAAPRSTPASPHLARSRSPPPPAARRPAPAPPPSSAVVPEPPAAAGRPREADRACVVEHHPQSAFMHGPVMPPAKLHQVVEPGRAAVRPVPDVMRIAPPGRATWEAATPIPRGERTAERRRDRARLPTDVQHLPGHAVGHDDPPGVTRQPLRRFRGDAQPTGVLQHRLTMRGVSSVAET